MKNKLLSLILAGALLTPATVFANDQLVDQLYEKSNENILISDLSINLALSMLAQGADGDTLQELEEYLKKENLPSAEELQELMVRYHSMEHVTLSLANSLWSDLNCSIQEEYQQKLESLYEAAAESLDFSEEASAEKINQWCSDHTMGFIPEIIDANALSTLELVLTNALYFQADWEDAFELTFDETFTNLDETQAEVKMMHSQESIYLENEYATGFMKEYGDNIFYIGILPKEEGEFALSDLDLEGLLDSASRDVKVDIGLPKYTSEYQASLAEVLPELGLSSIFQSGAELNHIADTPVSVSDILHKTYMNVDEAGTEAAAATAVMVAKASLPMEEIKSVVLNRPFAYGIYDAENNIWIFQGKIVKF